MAVIGITGAEIWKVEAQKVEKNALGTKALMPFFYSS